MVHGPGRSNIPDIAIHLWRLKGRPVVDAPAFPVGSRVTLEEDNVTARVLRTERTSLNPPPE